MVQNHSLNSDITRQHVTHPKFYLTSLESLLSYTINPICGTDNYCPLLLLPDVNALFILAAYLLLTNVLSCFFLFQTVLCTLLTTFLYSKTYQPLRGILQALTCASYTGLYRQWSRSRNKSLANKRRLNIISLVQDRCVLLQTNSINNKT